MRTRNQQTQIIATFAVLSMCIGYLLGYVLGLSDGHEDGCRGKCQVVQGKYEVRMWDAYQSAISANEDAKHWRDHLKTA